MSPKKLTNDELQTLFLQFCRDHYAKHSSEILLGENARINPEFVITPVKKRNTETSNL